MHANGQIRCIWLARNVVVGEIVRIQSFWGPWNKRQDVVDDSAGCGGRREMQTRGMWRTTFCSCHKHPRKLPINENSNNFESKLTGIYDGYGVMECMVTYLLSKWKSKLMRLQVLPCRNLQNQSERCIWYFIHILDGSIADHCAILHAC